MQLLRIDPHHPVFVRAFEGFAVLLKVFGQAGKVRDIDGIDEGFYGFYVAPAMNSPRRTGDPLEPCFTVFTAPAQDAMLEAAHEIITTNDRRKELVEIHTQELDEGDQPLAPWVYFSEAYPGMYGLLANRMMERHGHPVVVVNRPAAPEDFVSGSGRAPSWFGIIDALEPHDGMRAIGHQQACGVRVDRAELLDILVEVLREATQAALLDVDPDARRADLVLGPDDDCDADLDEMDPLISFVRRVEALRPFGHGFVEPVVEIAIEPLGLRVDRIGSDADCPHERTDDNMMTNARGYRVCRLCKRHLRLVTRSGLSCLWWNVAEEKEPEFARIISAASRTQTGTLRFIAKLQLNTFRGETRVQAVIDEQIPVSV